MLRESATRLKQSCSTAKGLVMELFIKSLGMIILVIAILQLIRSFYYPDWFSKWNLTGRRADLVIWIARIGGIFGILLAIWMMFFVKF